MHILSHARFSVFDKATDNADADAADDDDNYDDDVDNDDDHEGKDGDDYNNGLHERIYLRRHSGEGQ